MRFRHCCAAAVIAAASTFAAAEPVPSSFTYQGVLEVDGQPVLSDADFIIRLYDGASLIETIAQPGIQVHNGRFNLDLGFDPANFDGSDYELEFLVRSPAGFGAYETLGARQPLSTVPYAFHANTADGLLVPSVVESGNAGILLTLNQTDTFFEHAALRVTWDNVVSIFASFLDRAMEVESDTAPIGILSRASQFPFAGILDDTAALSNTAAVLGEVRFDAPASSKAIWALNAQSGNQAELGTENYAGLFTGDVRISGDVTKQYAFGSYDLAAPIAYGYISSSGTVASGTPNFSCVWNSSTQVYEIQIDDESYFFNDYVTVVTVNAANVQARVSSSGGRMLVYLERISDQTRTTGNFQFVTYKPDGAAAVAGFARPPMQPLHPSIPDDQDIARVAPPAPRTPIIEQTVTESPLEATRD